MRWILGCVAFSLSCGGGQRSAEQPKNPADFATKLSAASKAKDVAAIRALLRDEVTYGGLLFSDPKCAKQFAAAEQLSGPSLDLLANCLTTLGLEPSNRQNELPDVAVLTYAPGIEVEAQFASDGRGPWLRSIGFVARREADTWPTISPATLETLRVAGSPAEALPADADISDELAGTAFVWAWLKLCLDGEGTVTGADLREASSPRVARLFTDAVKAWKFKPFTVGATPVPACSMVRLAHPAADADAEVLPLPLPPNPEAAIINVPNQMLGIRRAGSTLVVPDDRTKIAMSDAGIQSVVSAFQFCLDTNGRVARVQPIRPTGYASYDKQLVEAIKSWEYPPFRDGGEPVAVCSSVRFVYKQQ